MRFGEYPSYLDKKIDRLRALYHKFGVDGLRDCEPEDISLLINAKHMEKRHCDHERKDALELEVRELQQQLKRGKTKSVEKSRGMER